MKRHLFLYRKKYLAGKKFDDDDEVQEEVMTWFKRQAADFYDSGIQKLVPGLNKRLGNADDYVEKYSYVQAIHSQGRFCKLRMLYLFKTFLSLLSGYAYKWKRFGFINYVKSWHYLNSFKARKN
jgi:hypothetical protein